MSAIGPGMIEENGSEGSGGSEEPELIDQVGEMSQVKPMDRSLLERKRTSVLGKLQRKR